MDLELEGKIALVTGGSRGIGRAIAGRLAAQGCDVALVARTKADLEQAASEIARDTNRRVEVCAADLRTPESQDAVESVVRSHFGRLDILVNNAGAVRGGPFLDVDDDQWEDGFALKFFGCVRMCRTFWPMLKESHGAVVNMSGTFAQVPHHNFMIGGAVNAAVMNFSKALANLGLVDDVNVNCIFPGGVAGTDVLTRNTAKQAEIEGIGFDEAMARNLAAQGIRRFATPEDVAVCVSFLVSPVARHVQGTNAVIDGGAMKGL